jgi:hypothetical protein
VDLIRQRLRTQRLTGPPFSTPVEAVRFFGAVQAQDYYGALWAIGQRTKGATEPLVERAVTDRIIVRSWPLRGTLHFVAAEDLRWMVSVLAPRTLASTARRFDAVGLDPATRKRARHVVEKALAREGLLTRRALYQHLEAARISTAAMRGMHIVWGLAHEGVICCGARQGTQHTFALFDEWLPPTPTRDRESALAELARRYFTSHGPATLSDFTWWSGLTAAEAKSALESIKPQLAIERSGGGEHWRSVVDRPVRLKPDTTRRSGRVKSEADPRAERAWLLPAYDEYTVAYRDRRPVVAPKYVARSANGLRPAIVIDGQVVGTWSCVRARGGAELRPFVRLNRSQAEALDRATDRFRRFSAPVPPEKTKGPSAGLADGP